MINTREVGRFRFAVGGIATEQIRDFLAMEANHVPTSVQGAGHFDELVQDALNPAPDEREGRSNPLLEADPASSLRHRGAFEAPQVLGAGAPMDRSISCQVPATPLDHSLLDRLVGMVTAFFVGETDSAPCPESPQVVEVVAGDEEIQPPVRNHVAEESVTPSPPARQKFDNIILKAAAIHDVHEDLIRAIIAEESRFNPSARSREGAMGLMQLMPLTAREMGVRQPYNPEDNIMGGAMYLSRLLDRYGGDVKLALAAYNWGPTNLEQNPNRLPKSTQRYIANVLARMENREST